MVNVVLPEAQKEGHVPARTAIRSAESDEKQLEHGFENASRSARLAFAAPKDARIWQALVSKATSSAAFGVPATEAGI